MGQWLPPTHHRKGKMSKTKACVSGSVIVLISSIKFLRASHAGGQGCCRHVDEHYVSPDASHVFADIHWSWRSTSLSAGDKRGTGPSLPSCRSHLGQKTQKITKN